MKPLQAVLSLAAFAGLASCIAQAQATRTWVSGVGDDANPCSRTSPCKTFAGAISKTAAGGEIDALDPGGFGSVTITKAITIDGGGGQVASVLVSGTNGIVVSGGPADVVTLRNLNFQGLAQTGLGGLNGIVFNSGAVLHIEHCAIMNFTQNGINLVPTAGAQVFIDNTVSRNNLGDGLNVKGSGPSLVHVSVSSSLFLNNATGVFAADFSEVTVTRSESSGNSAAGFAVEGSSNPAVLNLVESTAANNIGNGATAGGGGAQSTLRATNVALFNNRNGFLSLNSTGKVESFANNSSDATPITTIKLGMQ
jgi:hypothetical protein